MVGGAEQSAAQVRHGKAEEDNRAAIGSDHGHKDTRTDYDAQTRAAYIETQIAGIGIAEQHQVECLYEKERQGQQAAHEHDEHGGLASRHTGEAAETPHDIGANILLGAEELEHTDDGIGYISYHHAHYEQRDVAPHPSGREGDKGHDQQ